jgi:hypothetical protein
LFVIRHYHTTSFENVCRARLRFSVSEEHLVVFCPVLVILLKEKLRLNTRTASGEVLPPLFWVVCFWVKRQLLAVNTDCLATKLLCVFFDHLFPSTLLNFSSSSCGTVLLLHSQMTHFSSIKSLLCILYSFKIMFKCL